MKVIAKAIEVIVHFDAQGVVNPLRFKYIDGDGSEKVIKVDKVISNTSEKLCGNIALIFDCQSVIDGEMKLYQIKYFPLEMKWLLWKI
jgi:hypothetical protein